MPAPARESEPEGTREGQPEPERFPEPNGDAKSTAYRIYGCFKAQGKRPPECATSKRDLTVYKNRFDAQLAIKTFAFRLPIVSTNVGKHFDDGQNDVKMISRRKQSF